MTQLCAKDGAYWGSWAISHMATMGLSVLLCTIISVFVYPNSSSAVLLVSLLLVVAALLSFSYCMSTFFSTTRTAGVVASLVYFLAAAPGWVPLNFTSGLFRCLLHHSQPAHAHSLNVAIVPCDQLISTEAFQAPTALQTAFSLLSSPSELQA